MLTTSEAERMLREAGLRVTRPRVAVLLAVQEHPHADTETIIAEARAQASEISHQAVYDTLHRLTELGMLRCIQPKGSLARYETRIGDNHHHAFCRSCGAVADVDCAIGAAPCLTPSDRHGFVIEHAEVVYWGLCPQCQTAGVRRGAAPLDDSADTDATGRHPAGRHPAGTNPAGTTTRTTTTDTKGTV